jgi:radical SAM superfamily enzyme YgiQ (UPF0313 family)
MKIALLAPAGAMHRHGGLFARALHYAPLTLSTLAGLVPEEMEAEIEIYDETVEAIPTDLDADLIGITAITGTSVRCYRWADYYRARGATVVLGGVHPTLVPEEAASHANAVVVGPAEQSWPQLLRDYRRGSLRPVYREEPGFTLEGRPHPRRDLLKRSLYVTANSVEASRGCSHRCTFCVVPSTNGNRILVRPTREVAEEIERLPGKEVIFVDPNLIANPAYARKLFDEIAPLKRWWFGLVTSVIDHRDDLLDAMARSGCRGVLIGLESVTSSGLGAINKRFNVVENYPRLVKKLHDRGIGLNGTFVFGTDGDDTGVFARTVDLVQELKIDLPRYAIVTPFPRTPFYQELETEGRIRERDWSLYDVEHCVFEPRQMSREQLEAGLEWAWRQTYSAGAIAHRIASFSLRGLIDVGVNLGYRQYAKKLPHFGPAVMSDHSDVPAASEVTAA